MKDRQNIDNQTDNETILYSKSVKPKNISPSFTAEQKSQFAQNARNIELKGPANFEPDVQMPFFQSHDTSISTENQERSKWITKSFNPDIYHLKLISNENEIPEFSTILFAYKEDLKGKYLEYRLVGRDNKIIKDFIRQEDTPDFPSQDQIKNIDSRSENILLSLILKFTTQRNQTNADHKPFKPDLGPYRPYIQPKGTLKYDERRKMYFYKENTSTTAIKTMGLFALKIAVAGVVAYTAYQHLKPK